MTVETNEWALNVWDEYFQENYTEITDTETLRDNWFDYCDQDGNVFDTTLGMDILDAMAYPFRSAE